MKFTTVLFLAATMACALSASHAEIRLRSGIISAVKEPLAPSATVDFYGSMKGQTPTFQYIVKFNDKKTHSQVQQFLAQFSGISSVGPSLPVNAWVIITTHEVAFAVQSHQDVAMMTHLRPGMKLAPELVLKTPEGHVQSHASHMYLDHAELLVKYVKHINKANAPQERPPASPRDLTLLLDHDMQALAKHDNTKCREHSRAVRDHIVAELTKLGVSASVDANAGRDGALVRVESADSILRVSFPVHSLEDNAALEQTLDNARAAVIEIASSHPQVQWVEPAPVFKILNKAASGITQSYANDNTGSGSTPIWDAGLKGEDQIVGIADTGVDWDNCFFSDSSFHGQLSNDYGPISGHRKFAGLFTTVKGVDGDAKNGHGTHVSGSVTGACLSNSKLSPWNGMAPKAKMSMTAMENSFGALNVPTNIETELFPLSKSIGAKILTNSWGSAQNTYTAFAQQVDSFMYDNDDTVILFAAGNAGPGPSTIGSPATNKNGVAVGAQDTSRSNFVTAVDYYDMVEQIAAVEDAVCGDSNPNPYPCCTSGGCFKTTSDCCNGQYTNNAIKMYCCPDFMKSQYSDPSNPWDKNYMADFSSRGPTADGRIKPDVSAPGQIVISARSDGKVTGDVCSASFPTDGNDQAKLLSMSGTSMATPVTAGNTALIREYFINGFYPGGSASSSHSLTPSGALMRAILVHSAQSLDSASVPNDDEGYGRIQLDQVLEMSNSDYALFVADGEKALGDGDTDTTCIKVASSSQPLKVTLAYTDAPGTPMSYDPLVNTLTLELASPSAHSVKPTGSTGSKASIEVSSPDTGEWIITVTGNNVVKGSQKFALVITGAFATTGCSSSTLAHRTVRGSGADLHTELLRLSPDFIAPKPVNAAANGTSPTPVASPVASPAASPAGSPAGSPAASPAASPVAHSPVPNPSPSGHHPVHSLPPNAWAIETVSTGCAIWELSNGDGELLLESVSDSTWNSTMCTFKTAADARAAALAANATITALGSKAFKYSTALEAVYVYNQQGQRIGVRHYMPTPTAKKKLIAAVLKELPIATVVNFTPPSPPPVASPTPNKSPATSPSPSPNPENKDRHLKMIYVVIIGAGAFVLGIIVAALLVYCCMSKKSHSSGGAGYSSMPDVH